MRTNGEPKLSLRQLRREVVGIDTMVPLLDGSMRRYIFLDNAASTPTFRRVVRCIEDFLPWYSGVHRGTGFKSLIATEVFDRAHEVAGEFVGANLSTNVVIFVKNTTEAINKLSNRFHFDVGSHPFGKNNLLITTTMEHHSDDLPWRKNVKVMHIGIRDDGSARGGLDLRELQRTLKTYRGKVNLVAITGASNITGICNPIHDIAVWAHEAGAKIFVDAAQLAPHRPINILPDRDPRHIDFIAFSAHKMYAPFGTGVLVGPKDFFAEGDPDLVGGGTVEIVSLDEVVWNQPPHKEEAGSPNVVGGVALAEAIAILQEVGMETIAEHEHELLEYAYRKIKKLPKVILYGPTDNLRQKVGVITFNIEGMHHALVASILSTEGGVGVRNGCFCAHPYVKKLLNVTAEEERIMKEEILCGIKSNIPGMVRASFGCYNNEEDVDYFVEMLERIVRNEYRGEYIMDTSKGIFTARGFRIDVEKFFPYYRAGVAQTERSFSETA